MKILVANRKSGVMDCSSTPKTTATTTSVEEEENVGLGNAVDEESPSVDNRERDSELDGSNRSGKRESSSKIDKKLDISEGSNEVERRSQSENRSRSRRHRRRKSRSQRKIDASSTSSKMLDASDRSGIREPSSENSGKNKHDVSEGSNTGERCSHSKCRSRSRRHRVSKSLSQREINASFISTKSERSTKSRSSRRRSRRSESHRRGRESDEGGNEGEQNKVKDAKKEIQQFEGSQKLLDPPYHTLTRDDYVRDAKSNIEVLPINLGPAPNESSGDESAGEPPQTREGGLRRSIVLLLEMANILRKADEKKEQERANRRISITSILVPRVANINSVKQVSPMDQHVKSGNNQIRQKLQSSVTSANPEDNKPQQHVPQCNDCKTQLPQGGYFSLKKNRPRSCSKCQTCICQTCASNRCLIPFKEYDKNPLPLKRSSIHSYCKSCFKQVSILDHRKSYDIILPDQNKKNVTFLWVHGGGGSRAMFRPHASVLAHMGYYSILLDLPGHGAQADVTLTLESCLDTVRHVLDTRCGKLKEGQSSRLVYVGASLGAYIGFHILGQLKNRFAGAILLDCGQNVGPDCSGKTWAGLWLLRTLSKHTSNKMLMRGMMRTINKSKADYHLAECNFAGGMFFQQGPAWVDCMHAVSPAEIIPTVDIPILFFNGSKNQRDSLDRWLDLCNDKGKSSLFIYHGDHFFCHDSRYVEDMFLRMDAFVREIGLGLYVGSRTKRPRPVAI
mmetsp:Transcript_24187/g.58443  ORF Transcript_24187/g.58443 Transcript_24187/m.58443 type:complete len:734 (-) Transcript_24187:58-2259(-)